MVYFFFLRAKRRRAERQTIIAYRSKVRFLSSYGLFFFSARETEEDRTAERQTIIAYLIDSRDLTSVCEDFICFFSLLEPVYLSRRQRVTARVFHLVTPTYPLSPSPSKQKSPFSWNWNEN
jgi:hypothetical protein